MRPASRGGRKRLRPGIRRCDPSVETGRGAAIDRDRGALDLARGFRAQEQSERGDIFRRAHAAGPALGEALGAHCFDRLALRRRALLHQLLGALGRGLTGMDGIDVHAVAHAEARQSFGEVGSRGIDGAADQNLGLDGARGAADDVDDVPFGGLEQRPEQTREPHRAEEFQRKAVEPELICKLSEIAGAGGAGIVDQHVATVKTLIDALEQLLAALELAQIAGHGHRLRPLGRHRLGGGGEVLFGRRSQHGLRAFPRKCLRDAAANTAASTRDDNDLVLELARHFRPPCLSNRGVLLWFARPREPMKSIFVDCTNDLVPVFRRVLSPGDPPITINDAPFQAADLPRLLKGYDICLDDHSYLPTEALTECRGLKHVVFLGTGASSYMDVAALSKLGIEVHTIKGYGDIAVAEHTVALLFASCRELARMDRAARAGTWEPLESMQLKGKTLGLIGLGGIGREVARIADGIGMEVIGWNRTPRPEAGVPLVGLDDLLARADVISLHLALTDETRGLLDAGRIARTRPGVILVNTARGALVDEPALIDGLRSGHIRHAGLDVFHAEPLAPDHPLARMENVTITSHAAFRTLEASETLMRRAIDIVAKIVGQGTAAAP